jgi:hypothetical protein
MTYIKLAIGLPKFITAHDMISMSPLALVDLDFLNLNFLSDSSKFNFLVSLPLLQV